MQQRSEATHRQILEAARQQFALAGYDATGVSEICAAAGISKGAFYHHFPSKQQVFLDLLEEWIAGLESEVKRAMEAEGSIPDRLLHMAALIKGVFDIADGRLPLFLEFWRQASKDPQVWRASIEPYRRFEHLFIQLVERGKQEGTIRPLDSDTVARSILALAIGMLLQGILDPQSARWDETTVQGIGFLIDGIRRKE